MSSGPFASIEDYEHFIYSLPAAYSEIKESSLVLVRYGARLEAIRGTILIVNGWSLVVMERFRWDRTPLVLDEAARNVLSNCSLFGLSGLYCGATC